MCSTVIQAQPSWTASGTDVLYVNPTSAEMGIGTTDPEVKGHIQQVDTSVPTQLQMIGASTTGAGGVASEIMFGAPVVSGPGTITVAGIQAIQATAAESGSRDLAILTGNGNFAFEAMRFAYDGQVGVGTDDPDGTMHVSAQGGTRFCLANSTAAANGVLGEVLGRSDVNDPNNPDLTYSSAKIQFFTGSDWGTNNVTSAGISFYTNDGVLAIAERMRITPAGDVGIGITDPETKSSKLAVNGKIWATEVVVEPSWADHVFADDYELATLTEVEDFIVRNGHLPNMPTEQEVTQNGVDLGDMQAPVDVDDRLDPGVVFADLRNARDPCGDRRPTRVAQSIQAECFLEHIPKTVWLRTAAVAHRGVRPLPSTRVRVIGLPCAAPSSLALGPTTGFRTCS